MKNRRDSDRTHSYAKAVFLFYDLIGYVRDISGNGLRIEVLADTCPERDKQIHTTIIPHPDLQLEPFNILTKIRWTKLHGPTIAVGLQVVSFSSAQGEGVFHHLKQIFQEAENYTI